MSGLEFPAGSMLTVLRAVEGKDIHGDPIGDGYVDSHQIGPCAISRSWGGRKVERQERLTNRISITCTDPDADVLATDRLRLPNGLIVDVSSTPLAPRNPFTGWCPGLRFTVEEVV